VIGMAVAAVSAAVASFAGLRGLAGVAGWPEQLAWLLPITVDAYAMTSARVWLAGTVGSKGARSFARANAIGAIVTSIVGNAGYHLNAAGLITISWPIIVLVGAVPAAVLGLTAHLHALTTPIQDPAPTPTVSPQVRTRRTDSDLLDAARDVDAQHRVVHNGRPISRDGLRTALRIAGPKATELRRQLTAETDRKEASTRP
jgi:MFS family permease